eukprot:scaffold6161_cov72-Phaeocystis_antarctica.AAC.4
MEGRPIDGAHRRTADYDVRPLPERPRPHGRRAPLLERAVVEGEQSRYLGQPAAPIVPRRAQLAHDAPLKARVHASEKVAQAIIAVGGKALDGGTNDTQAAA